MPSVCLDYGRQDDGRYLGGTVCAWAVLLQVQFIEPPLSVGDKTKVSPLILLLTPGPLKVAVMTPVATATWDTYLPLIDVALVGRPADWLVRG